MNKSFIIPEFAKVTNIKIQDNLITVYYEPIEPQKEFIPKDGDFCTLTNNEDRKYFFIFKNESRDNFYFYAKYTDSFKPKINLNFRKSGTLTPATESEKQLLLSEIDKAGFVWNAEKKRIEKKRWRAERTGSFYVMNSNFNVCDYCKVDCRGTDSNISYNSGNYFQTFNQAAEFGNLSKELAFHFHEQDEILTKIKELLCANN